MGGKRSSKTTKYSLSFHLSSLASNVRGSVQDWAEARLISASSIEMSGRMVPISGLEALYDVASTATSDATADTVLKSLSVRLRSPTSSIDCNHVGGALANTGCSSDNNTNTSSENISADIWAMVEVDVRPNAHVCTNPALRPAWCLLLSRLVNYPREKAFTVPRPSQLAALSESSCSNNSNTKTRMSSKDPQGLGLRLLEEVFTSLKPRDDGLDVASKDQGQSRNRPGLGPGPGAQGLSALPTAVVMKVAYYLPSSGLDALSGTCKGHHQICSSLVPGLKLDLFPHQAEGLRWMRDRERGRDSHLHREFVEIFPSCTAERGVAGGVEETDKGAAFSDRDRLWVNVVDGFVTTETPGNFRAVRGGMLCDEPGLGKTITVLALLLRTRGLLPGPMAFLHAPETATEGGNLRSGSGKSTLETSEQWRHWGNMERQVAMIKVVRALQLQDPTGVFSRPLDGDTLGELGMPDYLEIVQEPVDLQTIARRASARTHARDPSVKPYQDFAEFASDVRRVFSNAALYHDGGGVSPAGGGGGDQQVLAKARARAIPAVAEAARRLGQGVEGLLERVFVGRRVARGEVLAQRLRELKPSSASLIVVPPPMLPHWRNQLTLYAQPGRLGPLFFDERSDQPLPPADELRGFGVVVTTYQRLTNEQPRWAGSPLAEIYWLRMVLDEGHAMGTSALTSCGLVCRLVEAERRWVMTGTPTPKTSADVALRNLSNLLHVLREKEFVTDWRRNIRGPFVENRPEGRQRLRGLLSEVMIRHTKSDVLAIPPPVRESVILTMSQQEALAYSTIVSFVRSNLLLTSMEGKTSGWQDSLLNPINGKYAMEAVTNIRLSCCGGGTLIPVVKHAHHAETMEMLRDLHCVSVIDLRRVDNFINRATMGEVSSCQGCGEPLQLLHVTPCAHLVCVDCVDVVNNACGVCGEPYDVDDFQRIQPGFELRWMYNVREQERLHQQRRAAARLQRQGSRDAQGTPTRPNHASQGVAEGGGWGSEGASGSTGASPSGDRSPLSPGGNGGLVLEEEEEEELEMHSKAFYIIRRLRSIREGAAEDRRRSDCRQVKAIVFSQFLPVLNIVGDKFLREFGGYPANGWQQRGEKCVAEFWGKNRARELERFRTDPECFVLLLGRKGAHGLDLSFVTHMFLMDQIWDRSLETQVVARANRMGAKGSVTVVQLIMKDTMEQKLRSYVSNTNNSINNFKRGSQEVADSAPGTRRSPARPKKSPWEKTGSKRPRRLLGTAAGAVPATPSQHQEHAKVHFLLTSLRSCRGRAMGGDGEGECEQEFDGCLKGEGIGGPGTGSALSLGSKGKGKGKDKGGHSCGKRARKGVTFADHHPAGEGDVYPNSDEQDEAGEGGQETATATKRRRVTFVGDGSAGGSSGCGC